jgi:hypothetical protein
MCDAIGAFSPEHHDTTPGVKPRAFRTRGEDRPAEPGSQETLVPAMDFWTLSRGLPDAFSALLAGSAVAIWQYSFPSRSLDV